MKNIIWKAYCFFGGGRGEGIGDRDCTIMVLFHAAQGSKLVFFFMTSSRQRKSSYYNINII